MASLLSGSPDAVGRPPPGRLAQCHGQEMYVLQKDGEPGVAVCTDRYEPDGAGELQVELIELEFSRAGLVEVDQS